MNWTREKLEEETTLLQPKDEKDIVSHGVKRGRPTKPRTIKTYLDLSEDLAAQLDAVAEFMGSTRQGVVKGFILNGLKDYYFVREAEKRIQG
ncbi:MAG: hypothetical protein ETSY1_42205 [Candidatus Entotheonella factor]|uniref:Uncharacterized protein n=1 Tax=Entotheonella factor TaxID=1429438 RepID=W4L3X2_ENTF1|nr:MAG: hypothetical protein ETSY1_42205 [Candidatus Entotheonella factor]